MMIIFCGVLCLFWPFLVWLGTYAWIIKNDVRFYYDNIGDTIQRLVLESNQVNQSNQTNLVNPSPTPPPNVHNA